MNACRGAVKANDPLTLPEMRRLLDDMRRIPNPWACVHGRPRRCVFPSTVWTTISGDTADLPGPMEHAFDLDAKMLPALNGFRVCNFVQVVPFNEHGRGTAHGQDEGCHLHAVVAVGFHKTGRLCKGLATGTLS